MFVIASPSLLDQIGKERGTLNGGWCIGIAVSAAAHPIERAIIVALVKKMEIIANDGGYAWKAPNAPPVAPPTVVVSGFAVIRGF